MKRTKLDAWEVFLMTSEQKVGFLVAFRGVSGVQRAIGKDFMAADSDKHLGIKLFQVVQNKTLVSHFKKPVCALQSVCLVRNRCISKDHQPISK